jgi:hypothetical protein
VIKVINVLIYHRMEIEMTFLTRTRGSYQNEGNGVEFEV